MSGRSRANNGVLALALDNRYNMIAPSTRITPIRYCIPRDSSDLRAVWMERVMGGTSSDTSRTTGSVARAKRVDLQGFGQQRSVHAQPDSSGIDRPRIDIVLRDREPLVHAVDDRQSFVECVEVLVQIAERNPVLSGERVVRQAMLLTKIGDGAAPQAEGPRARLDQLEVDDEVERQPAQQRFLEGVGQHNLVAGIQHVGSIRLQQLGCLNVDSFGM